jgi:membrane-associated phospholipid phosphatase
MEHQILDQKSKKKFAKLISTITHPPLLAIPTFIVINVFLLGLSDSIVVNIICMIFAAILPILTSLILIKKMNTDIDITDRRKRTLPLFFAVCSYIIGFFVLYVIDAPAITTTLMLIYSSNTLIILLINLSWKISIHAMGVAGPTAALIYLFGIPGVIFGLIIPIVMWSRVMLRKHSISQVLAGSVLGLIITSVQLYYFVPLIG